MRFNSEADNVRGGNSPLGPMVVKALWEAAGKGSRGLAEIPQGMAVQEETLKEHGQESSQEGLAPGGAMKGQRPGDKWLQKRQGLCLWRA